MLGFMSKRRLLVTSALPYANGTIHLGHLMEHIQTDIWVRFQRMRGHECIYVCADDAHGTATMLAAEAQGVSPEALIAKVQAEHQRDFADFGISHDNYHTTHSPENRDYSELIYRRLVAAGQIETRQVQQLYDPQKKMFLADRFIVGKCPRCGADGQYGDNCESCGATYDATELGAPVSKLSGATPVLRESQHFFFKLSGFAAFLKQWSQSGALQPEVANKLAEWLDAGLQDWCVSRDAPYFGFEIPGEPGKFFYVWLDAPIGYMASFRNYCERAGLAFDDFWREGSPAELHHFIGKDIVNFHALFWPAVLKAAGYRLPSRIHAHGFVTVNGVKMSKSRGTFINARTWLERLQPDYLRYYLAAKMNAGVDDLDINLDDLVQRVNADLVGKLVNIAARSAGFISKRFGGEVVATGQPLFKRFLAAGEPIATHYEAGDYGKAVREAMALADLANQFIDERRPWALVKEAGPSPAVQQVCSDGINLFRILMGYLKPILPQLAERAEAFLACPPLAWDNLGEPLDGHKVAEFKPLLTRLQPEQVAAVVAASREAS